MSDHFYQIVDAFDVGVEKFVALWDMTVERRLASRYHAPAWLTLAIGDVLRCRHHGDVPEREAFYVRPRDVPPHLCPPFPLNAEQPAATEAPILLETTASPFDAEPARPPVHRTLRARASGE